MLQYLNIYRERERQPYIYIHIGVVDHHVWIIDLEKAEKSNEVLSRLRMENQIGPQLRCFKHNTSQ